MNAHLLEIWMLDEQDCCFVNPVFSPNQEHFVGRDTIPTLSSFANWREFNS